jgi:hypothetical protein
MDGVRPSGGDPPDGATDMHGTGDVKYGVADVKVAVSDGVRL